MKGKKILAHIITIIIIIISMQIVSIAKSEKEGRFIIDNPTGNLYEGKSIIIDGWLMSTDEKATMKVYIDDIDTGAVVNRRIPREDVLNIVQGYGGRNINQTPGFEIKLDVSNIAYGNHRVKYVLVDENNQEIASEQKNIIIDNRTKGRFIIDNPSANIYEGKSITIDGWQMSTDEKASMKVYIDDIDTGAIVNRRIPREDVLNIVQGYGGRNTNPNPGFEIKLDVSNIAYGNHRIKYVLVDENNQEISSQQKNITIDNRTKGRFIIDNPKENIYEGKSITIDGWQMSTDEKAYMKVYIDDKDTGAVVNRRIPREDVLNIVQGYGGRNTNPNPGFEIELDISNITYGNHKVRYVLIDRNNQEISSQQKNITIDNRTKGRFMIDEPTQDQIKEDNLKICGWIMSNDKNANLEVYIDNEKIQPQTSIRVQRPDVLEAVPGYGGRNTNQTPGFEIYIDVGSKTIGEHKITYILKSSIGEEIQRLEKNITIQKGQFYIDSPRRDIWDLKEMPIKGWMLSVDKEAQFKILINNEEVTINNIVREERPDVLNAIKGYGGIQNNPKPGFECKIDLSSYEKGQYNLTYLIQSKTGEVLAKQNAQITIDYTKKARICIDTPSLEGVEHTNGQIKGWIMTNVPNTTIDIYLDGSKKWTNPNRENRDDVLNVIKGYGGIENNPKPGYVVKINYGEYSLGGHAVKIVLKDENGIEIASEFRYFNIIEPFKLESGVYGLSGQGRTLRYYKIGTGPNVYFATFAVHGFEDRWDFDGQVLTEIAEEFAYRLERDKDRNILSKWTIYIFPQVNPDGAQAGWSNNGPGRHTLYSWAPGHQGVDLNRSWSTGYKKMTGRNYNGTAPFQAPEAANLRDFLLNHKSVKGQTVLVDLHGWTTQLIGDGGICNYYKNQFPNNSYTSSYGSGYLINWARTNLGANGKIARSALIELPSVRNYWEAKNNNYSGRYIEATLSMLRGL